MPETPIQIVVFDLGGVLVHICRTWEEGCRAAGLPAHEGWDHPESRDVRRALNTVYQRGGMESDEYFAGLAATARGLYTADEIRRIHHAWTLEEYPGVAQLIGRLHGAGLNTGVLSNTNHSHWARLSPPVGHPAPEYPSLRLIRHMHASHLLRVAKPDAAIYRQFERLTGFRPGEPGSGGGSQIIFFDDLEENVDAARAAGWLAHQIDHTGDTVAQMTLILRERRVLD